jgi:DNA sulfur modification protein DndC
VDKQKYLTNLIENGEEWMEVLSELREELKKTQTPEAWEKVRDKKRRHGSVELKYYGEGYTPGPYKMEFRREYLEKLLVGQLRVQKESPYPDMKLILDEEIHEIQRIWRMEQGDWQNSAYKIYEKVIGVKLESAKEDMGGFGEMEQVLLEQVCQQHNVPSKLVGNLLNAEFDTQGATRHAKVFGKIKSELSKEWREDMDEIMSELKLEKEERDQVAPSTRKSTNQDVTE